MKGHAMMKRKILKTAICIVVILAAFGMGSAATYFYMVSGTDGSKPAAQSGDTSGLKAYDDVRGLRGMGGQTVNVSYMDLRDKADIIPTLWFNQKTVWPSKKMPRGCDPADILENAKNPGLGVRGLHARGITGRGVNVAIIDQPMYQDHPEFAGKIKMYRDFDCKSESSMHGPAVASLLAGKTTGTAPDAGIYYAAAPSWLEDAGYYAGALDWIVEESAKLPAGEKIRVVSVSAAPSGPGSPFTKNNDQWDAAVARAEKEGLLVLDCTQNHGLIAPCFYDKGGIEKPTSYKPGFPKNPGTSWSTGYVFVPTSPRTTAEEYEKGDFGYQYTGQGGLSWAIPYCAGVLAMGWQVNPGLSPDRIVDLLFESAYKPDAASLIIDPPAFIKLVEESVKK